MICIIKYLGSYHTLIFLEAFLKGLKFVDEDDDDISKNSINLKFEMAENVEENGPNPRPHRVDEFPIHECVFRGDVKECLKELSALIRQNQTDLGLRDPHGNTALHLAAMLGRRECVHLLCAHGAPVKVKNKQGWSPLAEAIR